MYQIYILLFSSEHYYIGRSKNYLRRYTEHKWDLLNNKHGNPYMQRTYGLYGFPKCILVTHCIDCYSTEQALLDFNYGKNKCLNLSRSSLGGCSHSIPPIITRDNSSRCKIKTKDFPNIIKLLKILPVEKVARYYKVDNSTLYNLIKKHNFYYIKRKRGKLIGHQKRLKPLENRLGEFILDNCKLKMQALVIKYNVDENTISFWRKMYQAYKI